MLLFKLTDQHLPLMLILGAIWKCHLKFIFRFKFFKVFRAVEPHRLKHWFETTGCPSWRSVFLFVVVLIETVHFKDLFQWTTDDGWEWIFIVVEWRTMIWLKLSFPWFVHCVCVLLVFYTLFVCVFIPCLPGCTNDYIWSLLCLSVFDTSFGHNNIYYNFWETNFV